MNYVATSIRLLIFFVLISFVSPFQAKALIINELLASSSDSDETGSSMDWIEIFNSSDQDIDLTGYSLTDNKLAPRKWFFPPIVLPSQEYVLVWATGVSRYAEGNLSVNFRLSRDGEYLGLFGPDGALIDELIFPPQRRDISYGRHPLDLDEWRFFRRPTPGERNSALGRLGFAPLPHFSIPGGFHPSEIELTLSSDRPNDVIRYTVNGAAPTETSDIYRGPLRIASSTPVRAVVFRDDYFPSEVATHTYLIAEPSPLPVIAINTHPDNLFDSRSGIYANPTSRGVEWERPASIEFLAREGEVWSRVDAGLRIHGGASRHRSDKKSFRLYFRSDYGDSRLKNDGVIPEANANSFNRLVLRASYNDSWAHWDLQQRLHALYVSDELGRNLHGDMGFVSSTGTFYNLYLNGEYWGIYNVCERIDESFLADYYPFPEWDVISHSGLREGSTAEWNRFRSFVGAANFNNPDDYAALLSMVDIEQITAYYIINIWVSNHDWPHNNWYAARERHPFGRWKFLIWDIEDSFGSGASRGSFSQNTFNRAQGNGFIGDLFGKMIRSAEYQRFFIERLEYYLSTTLSEADLLTRLQKHVETVYNAMPMEAARWNTRKGLSVYDNAVESARRFIRNRSGVVRNHVYSQLRLPTPTPTPGSPLPTPTPLPPGPTPTPTPTPTPFPPGQGLGLFTAHADIGVPNAGGGASYNPVENRYNVIGGGWDIWGDSDEFHFLWREVSGDFFLEARIRGWNYGTDDWVKFCLMARDTASPNAKHFAARIRESNFEASSQWREQTGGNAGSTPGNQRIASNLHDGRLRLVREDNLFSTYYFEIQRQAWTFLDSRTVQMNNPILVGLAVTSHQRGSLAEGEFSEVRFEQPEVPVSEWAIFER